MSKDLPLIGERQSKNSEMGIAYVGVDVSHGQKLNIAMHQINLFKSKQPKYWFCDIIHNTNQLVYALHLKEQIEGELKNVMGINYDERHAVVHLNIASARVFRARDTMYAMVNEQREKGRAQEVNFRDPDGRKQEVEY